MTDNSITGLIGGRVSFISLDEHRIERKDLMFQHMSGAIDGGQLGSFSPGKSKFFEKTFNFEHIQEEEDQYENPNGTIAAGKQMEKAGIFNTDALKQ